jgi:hypothetical protein
MNLEIGYISMDTANNSKFWFEIETQRNMFMQMALAALRQHKKVNDNVVAENPVIAQFVGAWGGEPKLKAFSDPAAAALDFAAAAKTLRISEPVEKKRPNSIQVKFDVPLGKSGASLQFQVGYLTTPEDDLSPGGLQNIFASLAQDTFEGYLYLLKNPPQLPRMEIAPKEETQPEVYDFTEIRLETSAGKSYMKIPVGKWVKHGVPLWPEVLAGQDFWTYDRLMASLKAGNTAIKGRCTVIPNGQGVKIGRIEFA